MSGEAGQRRWRVPRWLLWTYVVLATPFFLEGCKAALLDFAGGDERNFVVAAEVPIRNVRVTFEGRPVEARPRHLSSDAPSHLLFPRLRRTGPEPVLEVRWTLNGVEHVASQVMRPIEIGGVCLYALRIGADGAAKPFRPPDPFDPFYVACYID